MRQKRVLSIFLRLARERVGARLFRPACAIAAAATNSRQLGNGSGLKARLIEKGPGNKAGKIAVFPKS